MFNANPPSLVPVFLYENLEKAVEMLKEKTVEGIIEAGGVIGVHHCGFGRDCDSSCHLAGFLSCLFRGDCPGSRAMG